MYKLVAQIKESGNFLISPPPSILRNNSPSSSSSSSGGKISPVILLIIVILAVIFFVAGILHLLVRYLMKRPFFISSNNSLSNYRNPPDTNHNSNSNSETLQRQLQQLFRLHDSGLDQPLIDALPVFYYKDIMGLKEPFDCAVCLCEFCDQDKLRLLPLCSHAFHISCIDTWLLSNSTCPLCRGSLLGSGLEDQEFSLEFWRAYSFGRSIDHPGGGSFSLGQSFNSHGGIINKPTIMEENPSERRVFSVRLGKFRSVNVRGESEVNTKEYEDAEMSRGDDGGVGDGSSSRQLDARRCYSLGSYQYVVAELDLQVTLSTNNNVDDTVVVGDANNIEKMMGQSGNSLVVGDIEGKKISSRNRRESFSVSKIWLWSKKGKFPGSSETNVNVNGNGNGNGNGGPTRLNVVLPLSTRDYSCP